MAERTALRLDEQADADLRFLTESGELMAKAQTSDPIDAHVAVLASRINERVLTSDTDDLGHLARYADIRVVAWQP